MISSDLQRVITQSYTPSPKPLLLSSMFDIKTWIEPAMKGLHNIIYPHCFKIFTASDGKVKMSYKQWSRDANWMPESSEGIEILKVMSFFK